MTGETGLRPRRPERRRRRAFRLVERRSGFDRRRPPRPGAYAETLLFVRDRPRILFELLLMVNLLSILDLIITVRILREGGVELNPLMAQLLSADTASAAAIKIALVGAGTAAIWLLRRRRPALEATLLLVAVFGALIAYECLLLAVRI